MDDGESIYEDNSISGGFEKISIKMIVLEQFRRCLIEGSKEMKKDQKRILDRNGVREYITLPDQRQVFINSVTSLENVLFPYLINVEDLRNDINMFNDMIYDKLIGKDQKIKSIKEKIIQKQNAGMLTSNTVFKIPYGELEDQTVEDILQINRQKLNVFSVLINKVNF